jgi:iron(III) transport system ATP-binding protein
VSAVEVVQVTKRYGDVLALDRVGLALDQGQLLAVLGPSGCGKTTLLRCIAGFEQIEHGRITLAGRVVALPGVHLPAYRRQVAVVPQDGALFPHLSVSDNVGFGLGRGAGRRGRVSACLEMVGLGGLGDRMPHQLSGGQQQRVAVARALAPRPPLVLLDEPFSALDASLRADLRRDVRTALREDGATALLVTHDQGEALSVADRVAVMRDGRILQVGSPAEVYRRPVDAWVARFVGDAMLLPVVADSGGGSPTCALGAVHVSAGPTGWSERAVVLVRPEQVRMARAGVPAGTVPGVPATVRRVAYHGHDALVGLDLDDATPVLVRVADGPDVAVQAGDRVRLWVEDEVQAYSSQVFEAGTYALG